MKCLKTKFVSMCADRHLVPIGCEGSIFPKTIDLSDKQYIRNTCDKFICSCKKEFKEPNVYVTGVQFPLVELINAANKRNVDLVLWHYNPHTQSFYKQKVWRKEEC